MDVAWASTALCMVAKVAESAEVVWIAVGSATAAAPVEVVKTMLEDSTTGAELEATFATAELEATGATLELDTADTAAEPPELAQAKLMLFTGVAESFGALKSHVISTYGQHTLSVPTFAKSPLTKTLVLLTALPTFAPVLSTNWNEVPEYVPVHERGTGWQSGFVSVSQETMDKCELRVATCTFWWSSVEE